MERDRKNEGFTLMELLIVIAVIGIMVAIVLSYLGGAKAKGRDGSRIAAMKQLEQTLEVYFSSCNAYPPSLPSGNLPPSMITDCSGSNIINSLPVDPLTNSQYKYKYYMGDTVSGLKYHLCATLELSASGLDKSGISPTSSNIPNDTCDGTNGNIYDKYGP